ncbi:MAG: acyl-CoA thioesterase [Acidobacteria bacterium]|nr:acyl-CoA thioesterase [Acidobacteriota bacterium]
MQQDGLFGGQEILSCGQEANIKKLTTKIRVYWADCDAAGILYYGNFFRFFEIAEEELYASVGQRRWNLYEEFHIGFPRAETWCRFRKPVLLGDLVEVTAWISRRSEKSLVFQYEMRRDGESELLAEGSSILVCVKRPEFHSVPIPQEILHLLHDYLPPRTARSSESK